MPRVMGASTAAGRVTGKILPVRVNVNPVRVFVFDGQLFMVELYLPCSLLFVVFSLMRPVG